MRNGKLLLGLLITCSISQALANTCRTEAVSFSSKKFSHKWARMDLAAPDPIGQVGQVIAVGRELVALGESLYVLAEKFRPTVTTDYTPVSVVPLDPQTREAVNPFDLEGFRDPAIKTMRTTCRNGLNQVVVTFTYSLWYSYGGSYDGKGKYLTGVIIIPNYVETAPGWNFASTMRVVGISNVGTREAPVASVVLNVSYTARALFAAVESGTSFQIKGNGDLRTMVIR